MFLIVFLLLSTFNLSTSASLAAFPDYLSQSSSTLPQLALTELYSNITLPTYGLSINKLTSTMIILSSLQFKCNQDLSNLVDNKNIFSAQNQLWICFSPSINLVRCDTSWSEITDCGTFIQIHYPFDEQVIDLREVSYYDSLDPIGMPLQKLCAGNYHIWLVVRSRMGRIVTRVAPLYIFYPSC